MKRIVKVLSMTVLMMMCGQGMAQSRGVMFVGASIPMEDYAEFDGFSDFSLVTSDADDAGAGVGFTAGLKWYFNVGVEGLDVMLSVDGIYNGPNSDLKTAYRNNESQMGNSLVGGSFKYNSTPKLINVPAMLGLNYIYHFNPNLGIYVEAGAGGDFHFITEMESVTKSTIAGVETQVRATQKYDNAFSFAYQAGIGIEVAKNLVISCSFYDLGKADVKGDYTVKTTTLNDNLTNTTKDYNIMGNVHPIMILGRVGFSF